MSTAAIELTTAPKRKIRSGNPFVIAINRAMRRPMGIATLTIVIVMTALAILAPLISPYNPLEMVRGLELQGPTMAHWFGTDEYGRDLLSRTLYGIRISMVAGAASTVVGAAIGVLVGLLAGYWRGWLDIVTMRIMDGLLAFPALLMGMAIVAALGPGLRNVTITIAIVQIPVFARLARATTLAEKNRDYVMAAETLGAKPQRIMFQHVLLNSMSPLLVQMAMAMGASVLIEAALSFLGLGIKPPEPSLGSILNASQSKMRHAYYYPILPGLSLSLLLFALNGMADALNDAFTAGRKV
jgi:peptide/nickel transport system permease protein